MPKQVLFNEQGSLQKAMELFWLKGYNGTSMDDLTKATGLSRSSIYNSFGDKYSLFIQCLDYYKAYLFDKLTPALENLKSPVKKIETVFRHSIDGLLNDKERKGCLIVNTTAELANLEEGISLFVKDYEAELTGLFQNWIKEGQESGEISKLFSSLALSRYVFNSYSGLKITAQTNPDRKTLE